MFEQEVVDRNISSLWNVEVQNKFSDEVKSQNVNYKDQVPIGPCEMVEDVRMISNSIENVLIQNVKFNAVIEGKKLSLSFKKCKYLVISKSKKSKMQPNLFVHEQPMKDEGKELVYWDNILDQSGTILPTYLDRK